MHVAAVVITYNRLELLKECVQALCRQTRPADSLFIVDNASSDGTGEWLREWIPLNVPAARVILLDDNTGGAGGFNRGLKEALDCGADWVWMMDDDAEPQDNALEELLRVSDDPKNVYGSLAVNGSDTSWSTTLEDQDDIVVDKVEDIPARASVGSLPFLGFMIHRSLVSQIGLPDAGFFILADDTEYCMRARTHGAKIIVAGGSRINHPKAARYVVRLPFRRITYLRLPPWKRYYHTRNKLIIARRYYGFRLFTQTLPGLIVRLMAALLREPDKLAQTRAFFAGLFDGFMGNMGSRHENWGLHL